MALEYAQHGVRVNAIAPARVETEMSAAFNAQLDEATKQTLSQDNPLEQFHGQMIQVAEVADIVAFLCSQKAKWINGAIIPIDGGYSAG